MNTFIDPLNSWSGRISEVALSLFWQSSLLIALVWSLDFILRKKLRASVRYALWLVVLVKLIAPPTLAIPSGLGWWMRETVKPEHSVRQAEIRTTDGPTKTSLANPAKPVAVVSQKAELSAASIYVIASAVISLGLLGWMFMRLRQVTQIVARAGESNALIDDALAEAKEIAGCSGQINIRITEQSISPAVCGLLQPTILLPRTLAEQLSASQLKAVLLHELTHLRRGDIWVNCAQALLQTAFWWHPLLWMANAKIRQLREEAVDDAVMLALSNDAEEYAPTLLEVAKLALDRPLASLGLVGILEGRSALHKRIVRLVNFSAPRKAGLTILSILGVTMFAAVAVPMGPAHVQAPSDAPNGTGQPEQPKVVAISEPSRETNSNGLAQTNAAGNGPAIRIEVRLAELSEFDPAKEPPDSPLKILPADCITNTPPEGDSVVAELRSKFRQPENLRLDYFSSGDRTNVLTSDQFKDLLGRIAQRRDSEMVSTPRVLTRDRRAAFVAVQDNKTIVTGVLTNENQMPGHTASKAQISYLTEQMKFGPAINIVPVVQGDGQSIHLTVSAHILEFHGYEDSRNQPIMVSELGAAPIRGIRPLPRFRVIEANVLNATVLDGQTIMIAGPVVYHTFIMKDKVPVLGDIPALGSLFRRESKSNVKKNLIIFVTTTLVDANGNPLHPDSKPAKR